MGAKEEAKNLAIKFITNLTYMQDTLLDHLENFKSVMFSCSLDAYGPLNDYMRHPSRWGSLEANFKKILSQSPQKYRYRVNITVSLYNVLRLPRLLRHLKKIVEEKDRSLRIYFCVLNAPRFLDLELLPFKLREVAASELKTMASEFVKHTSAYREILAMANVICKKTYSREEIERLRGQFATHLNLFDQSQKTNLLGLVPEISSILSGDPHDIGL